MTHGPRPGDFITPQVRLARPLAEGGMGRLWVAEHLGLHTEVVVKLMTEQMAVRADGLSRFRREAAAVAAIKSPHVIQIFDHGVTQDGVPYIVMERLEGEDLAVTLAKVGRLSPAVVVELIGQVGKALYAAHRAGIIHRDIKPDNIFLCEPHGHSDDGRAHHGPSDLFVKLLDFGTAKRDNVELGPTSPGQIMGTPYYMSPEQIVGAEQDARSDIWSLGVVAFEALTDRRPFEGSSIGAVTLAIHSPPPKLTSIDPSLPPAVDAWFARACAQLPADRFANAREASVAFAAAMTGQAPEQLGSGYFPAPDSTRRPDVDLGDAKTVASAPPLTATLADPTIERRKVARVAAGVGVAAILVMIGIVFGGRSGTESEPETPPKTNASTAPSAAEVAPPPTPSIASAEPAATPSPERRHHAPPADAGHARRRHHDAGTASPDDDLARLSNIPSSAPAPPPAPTSSEAPEPPPKIDVPPPAPAPEP